MGCRKLRRPIRIHNKLNNSNLETKEVLTHQSKNSCIERSKVKIISNYKTMYIGMYGKVH